MSIYIKTNMQSYKDKDVNFLSLTSCFLWFDANHSVSVLCQ